MFSKNLYTLNIEETWHRLTFIILFIRICSNTDIEFFNNNNYYYQSYTNSEKNLSISIFLFTDKYHESSILTNYREVLLKY